MVPISNMHGGMVMSMCVHMLVPLMVERGQDCGGF